MMPSDSGSWTNVPFDAFVEQQSQPVVLEVAHSVSDATELLRAQVLGFRGDVGDAGGVEAEHGVFPLRDGGGESRELWDPASAACW